MGFDDNGEDDGVVYWVFDDNGVVYWGFDGNKEVYWVFDGNGAVCWVFDDNGVVFGFQYFGLVFSPCSPPLQCSLQISPISQLPF